MAERYEGRIYDIQENYFPTPMSIDEQETLTGQEGLAGEQNENIPETTNEARANINPELTPEMKDAAHLFGMAMGRILEVVSKKPTPEQVDAFALDSTKNITRTVLNGETDQYFDIVRTFMSRLGEEITESKANNASLRLGQAMIQQKIKNEHESLGMRKDYKK